MRDHEPGHERIADLLSATVPEADEQFRRRLEERLLSRLEAAPAQDEGRQPTPRVGVSGAAGAPRLPELRASSPWAAFKGGFKVSRLWTTPLAVSLAGFALLALLFAGVSFLLLRGTPSGIRGMADPRLPPALTSTTPLATSLQPLTTVQASLLETNSLSWSPDGRTLATSDSGTVQMRDPASLNSIHGFSPAGAQVKGIAWSPTSAVLAVHFAPDPGSTGLDAPANQGFIALLENPAFDQDVTTLAHKDRILGMAWSPDGRELVTSNGSEIMFWDAAAGALRGQYHPAWPLAADTGAQWVIADLEWSSTDRIAMSLYRTVQIWNPRGEHELSLENPGLVRRLAWSPGGDMLAAIVAHDNSSSSILLWDATTGRQLRQLGPFGPSAQVSSIAWSTGDEVLAASILAADDDRVELYDAGTGLSLASLNLTATDLAGSPDGRILAAANSRDGVLVLLGAGPPAMPTATAAALDPTAAAALTVIPPPTEIPGLQETHVARATASPYATSPPSTVRTGSPALASGSRGEVSIELRLEGDTYLAGENGLARITVRNNSSAMLFAGAMLLTVVDEQGRNLEPWPMSPGPRGGWPGQERFFGIQSPLEPGAAISKTIPFQVPPWEQSRGRTYTAAASASFSRPDMQHPDRSDNVPIALETGPISLRVTQPTPEQQLKAELLADRDGYTLRVTDPSGQPVAGEEWGAFEVRGTNGSQSGPLQDSPDGTWSATWERFLVQHGAPLEARFWVAARGYVPATVTATISAGANYATPDPSAPIPTAVPAAATSTLTAPNPSAGGLSRQDYPPTPQGTVVITQTELTAPAEGPAGIVLQTWGLAGTISFYTLLHMGLLAVYALAASLFLLVTTGILARGAVLGAGAWRYAAGAALLGACLLLAYTNGLVNSPGLIPTALAFVAAWALAGAICTRAALALLAHGRRPGSARLLVLPFLLLSLGLFVALASWTLVIAPNGWTSAFLGLNPYYGWGLCAIPPGAGGLLLARAIMLRQGPQAAYFLIWILLVCTVGLAAYMSHMEWLTYVYDFAAAEHLRYGMDAASGMSSALAAEIVLTLAYLVSSLASLALPWLFTRGGHLRRTPATETLLPRVTRPGP